MNALSALFDLIGNDDAVVALGALSLSAGCLAVAAALLLGLGGG